MTTNYKQSKTGNKILVKSLKNYKKQKTENEVRSLVSNVFTKNQLDLILKRKKKVIWSTDEISKSFELTCLSQCAYLYVRGRNSLNYSLRGFSSLR